MVSQWPALISLRVVLPFNKRTTQSIFCTENISSGELSREEADHDTLHHTTYIESIQSNIQSVSGDLIFIIQSPDFLGTSGPVRFQ